MNTATTPTFKSQTLLQRSKIAESADCVSATPFRFLLSGLDTVEVCYYLRQATEGQIDFFDLGQKKEALRQSKKRDPIIITLGGADFLLRPYGSRNGYPFVIENTDYAIEFGEFNDPSFRVKFRSEALWRVGAQCLHEQFMIWAQKIGLHAYRPESLSRVDFTFDYELAKPDFNEDSVVSLSAKDNKYRDNGKLNGLVYGKGDVVLRIYDKVQEIAQQSHKDWFFQLWGVQEHVWRIEWQTRQNHLRRFGIRTFADLNDQQGDVLRYLAEHHDTLRIKGEDTNRSRWPLHPLWLDLQEHIWQFNCQGIWRDVDNKEVLEERLMRLGISVYGYLKRIAALRSVQHNLDPMAIKKAQHELTTMLDMVHDPLTWQTDVESRMKMIRMGQW